jgi:hypothetical protein
MTVVFLSGFSFLERFAFWVKTENVGLFAEAREQIEFVRLARDSFRRPLFDPERFQVGVDSRPNRDTRSGALFRSLILGKNKPLSLRGKSSLKEELFPRNQIVMPDALPGLSSVLLVPQPEVIVSGPYSIPLRGRPSHSIHLGS